jgi:GNAT superfamily N-acetyltransferase
MKPTFERLVESSIGTECKLNSWYLHILAVHPEHQKKGVGRKLIHAGEALVSNRAQ